MNQKADKWIDDHKDDLITELTKILKIRSLENLTDIPGKPFGDEVRKAEDLALDLSKRLGFYTKDGDGFYAYADLESDNNKELLGIIGHLDVVPEGSGWDYPPYEARIVDNKIYARGVLDDKGPIIASLFALKAVKESGLSFKRNVRIIFGLNEETGMKCVEKYCEKERIPDIGFTPDGSYPLCNSEFNICHAVFKKEYKSGIEFKSGEAPNIVPRTADAWVNGKKLHTEGKQTHASTPWDGINAAQLMIKALSNEQLNAEDRKVVDCLNKCLGEGYYGEGFDLFFEDKSGKLTCNLGIVDWNENGFTIVLDLRCPAPIPEQEIKDKLTKALSLCDANLSMWSFSLGYYLPEDTEVVKKLLNVYEERTGQKNVKPISMGGGTYARHLPNFVSFGPEGYMCDCNCHIPNEFLTVDQLLFHTKMYADAIIALACE